MVLAFKVSEDWIKGVFEIQHEAFYGVNSRALFV